MKKFIPICLIALTSLSGFSQSTVVNPFPKTITVTGSAEMEVAPDEIYVLIDLQEYEKKGSSKVKLEKIKADFINNCRRIGLPDSVITIASYDGDMGNPWTKKKKKKEELLASITYQVKFVNSTQMDELVNRLDEEATQNFRIARTSHSKLQEFRKQLKIEAIKAAKDKAAYLAAAIDEQVLTAVTITEPTDMIVQPYQLRFAQSNVAMAAESADGNTSMGFNKIKLHFDVNVVFALK